MYLITNMETLIKAIERYGKAQLVVTMEELSELTKELAKAYRGKEDREHITEEIADVEIMLQQIKLMFQIEEKNIGKYKNYKIKRLEQRMEQEELQEEIEKEIRN